MGVILKIISRAYLLYWPNILFGASLAKNTSVSEH